MTRASAVWYIENVEGATGGRLCSGGFGRVVGDVVTIHDILRGDQ